MHRQPSVRQRMFEWAGRLWPVRKGRHRWIKWLSRILGIGPYRFGRPKRCGPYHLSLDPGDVNDQLFYFSLFGHGYESLMRLLLRPNDTVIDAGANVGHFSAICAGLVGPSGAVHAVEASPHMVEKLERCVEGHPDGPIRIHRLAVTSACGAVTFYVATVSGWSSLVEGDTFTTAEAVQVPALTLDRFAEKEGIRHARVLKLDIEGAETDALIGAEGLLSANALDFVLLEAEPLRLQAFRHTGDEIASLMARHDYKPVCIIHREKIFAAPPDGIPGRFAADWLYARAALYDWARNAILTSGAPPRQIQAAPA